MRQHDIFQSHPLLNHLHQEGGQNGPVRQLDPATYTAENLTGLELKRCAARCRIRDRDLTVLDETDMSEMLRYVFIAKDRPYDDYECDLIMETTQNCPRK